MAKETISIANIRQDEWVNPFGANTEELVAGALEEGGLLDRNTTINGKNAHQVFQAYCKKKNLFQEATRLGNILIKENLVSKDALAQALQAQAESGKPLGSILIDMEVCTQEDIELALKRQQALREDFNQMEQARQARRTVWARIMSFFFDARDGL